MGRLAMIALLVSSKTMDLSPGETEPSRLPEPGKPVFAKEAVQLARALQKLEVSGLQSMMKISDRLALQTHAGLRAFSARPSPEKQRMACLAFTGDVYEGLDASSFRREDFNFARKHLRILSGIYGILKPLDAIQFYRLEPGYKWKPPGDARSIPDFWRDKITQFLKTELSAFPAEKRVILNLASKEFTAMIDFSKLECRIITPKFLELKDGRLRTIALYTKQARGAMARYLVKTRTREPERLKHFTERGYRFDAEQSNESEWVFVRKG